MSALRSFSRGRNRGLWVVGATLIAAAAFGVIFVASSGAAPPTCPTPGNFEIDGDMLQQTCSPGADDWNTPNIGVQETNQGGTYSTSGKDSGNPSTWTSSGSTPDKTDFAREYATSDVVGGHFFVVVAWERTATSGTQGYAIEVTNSGTNVAADGTPQPNRSTGGVVFKLASVGSSPPAFSSGCTYTSQANYGSNCPGTSTSFISAINTAAITDPLNGNFPLPAGSFFEVALDVTALTGVTPSCPGGSAASVYLRSLTGQVSSNNLKGYMAPLSVAPNSTCVPPPITTTATPGGSTAAIGSSQHDNVTVSDGTNVGVGSVKFFLCSPTEVMTNGGDCSANGTQVGAVKTLDGTGQASSDFIDGTTTPNDNAPGTYCWRAEFTPGPNDHHFLAGSHTNNTTECFTVVKNSPSIVTTPNPTSVTLGTSAVTLKDSAVLSGGSNPTGTITFTLVYKGTTVDTETATVNGNGTYTTATGFTLPSAGTVTGTYQWNATYSGDNNNTAISENNAASEQVTVNSASPTVVTTASPASVTLPGSVTFSDSAVVAGGYQPTGTLTFTLSGPSGFSYTQSDTVSGNGTYTASDGPISNPHAGTYTWSVSYTGDGNNKPAVDQGGRNEQTVVSAASPTIVTTPNPTSVTLGTSAVTLKDSAVLSGGSNPTGTITFTLVYKGTTVDTETVTVSGNNTYATPTGYTLPSSGTVIGTYQWNATYSGDANNGSVSETNSAAEQVTVNPASPTVVTTASPASVTLPGSVTFSDSAVVAGGYHATGTLIFTLSGPNGFSYTQSDTVSGNGTYTASDGPISNPHAGTYTWSVAYTGDGNNNAAMDQRRRNEQTVVSGASPTIVTTPNPTSVTLGASPVVLKDSAVLSGGSNPTGTITFTLVYGGSMVDTEMATVSGNGTYATPTGYTLPSSGTVIGTYQWNATYSGDGNNGSVSETNSAAEQVTVNPASPTVVTTASPASVTLPGSVTFSDSAVVAGGYHATGTLIFTLSGPNGFSYTQSDTVSGNATYTASDGPISNPHAGTYTWSVSYTGDGNNNAAVDQGGSAEQTVVSPASPSIVTTPAPKSVTLGTGTVTLNDSAVLSGGSNPTGTITFTLVYKGTTVDTETVTVSGNNTYSTPIGYTLPSSGTVTGTYQWNATYSGDGNNTAVSENNAAAEQVIVNPASPTIVTTPSPKSVTLDNGGAPTLTDSAVLSGGYHPTGTITFTLVYNSATVDTETVAVSGNGTYTTPTGFLLPSSGTVTGTYQWNATYSGDNNNTTVSETNSAAEQVTVNPASPTVVTTASGPVTLPASPTFSDSAVVSGGYHPTGTLTFTLTGPNGFSYTQTDAVSGNATYTASDGPIVNPHSGTYTWTVSYSGDGNNNRAIDQGGPAEQTVVGNASPSIVTTPSPKSVTLSSSLTTLNDSAVLSGGSNPTGSITFTLVYKSTTVDTETVTVSGNNTYTTPTGFLLPSSGTVTGTYQWNATYSGDGNNGSVSETNSPAEQVTVNPASPTVVTTASGPMTLPGAETFTDSAVLSGGYVPSGTLTFTLTGPNGFSYTQSDTVTGNGTYTAGDGPITNPDAGTYTWSVSYSGDSNNDQAIDQGGSAEQTVISPASPAIVTTPDPSSVTLGTGTVTLNDSAVLSGGSHPTGTITFTLVYKGSTVDTETVTVSGNNTYSTPTGFTLPSSGTVTGTYQWNATYSGDDNNNAVSENSDPSEQATVNPASPSIVTTPDPTSVPLGNGAVTLNDSAVLSGGSASDRDDHLHAGLQGLDRGHGDGLGDRERHLHDADRVLAAELRHG